MNGDCDFSPRFILLGENSGRRLFAVRWLVLFQHCDLACRLTDDRMADSENCTQSSVKQQFNREINFPSKYASKPSHKFWENRFFTKFPQLTVQPGLVCVCVFFRYLSSQSNQILNRCHAETNRQPVRVCGFSNLNILLVCFRVCSCVSVSYELCATCPGW